MGLLLGESAHLAAWARPRKGWLGLGAARAILGEEQAEDTTSAT